MLGVIRIHTCRKHHSYYCYFFLCYNALLYFFSGTAKD